MQNLHNDIAEWAAEEYGGATALTLIKILKYWEHMDRVDFTLARVQLTTEKLKLLAKTLHEITGD